MSKNRPPICKATKAAVFQRYEWACCRCGLKGKRMPGLGVVTERPGVMLTIDHIFPLSLGGTNHFRNLQVLCTPCHQEKDGLPVTEAAG